MKVADIIGFGAILAGGYYAGTKGAQTWSAWDVLIVVALLIAGFYFAVVLS